MLIGESIEPARVAEKLHQATFWQGRGGAVTHAISGIDIALWDLFGKITSQPISRLLGGRYRDRIKPYGSLIMAEPDELKPRLQAAMDRGFRAIKMGWGPFGRVSKALDENIVSTARETVGPDIELMVDAGAPTSTGRTATSGRSKPPACSPTTMSPGLRKPASRRYRRVHQTHRARTSADYGLRGADAPTVLHPLDRAPRGLTTSNQTSPKSAVSPRNSALRCTPTTTRSLRSPRLEHRRRTSG